MCPDRPALKRWWTNTSPKKRLLPASLPPPLASSYSSAPTDEEKLSDFIPSLPLCECGPVLPCRSPPPLSASPLPEKRHPVVGLNVSESPLVFTHPDFSFSIRRTSLFSYPLPPPSPPSPPLASTARCRSPCRTWVPWNSIPQPIEVGPQEYQFKFLPDFRPISNCLMSIFLCCRRTFPPLSLLHVYRKAGSSRARIVDPPH